MASSGSSSSVVSEASFTSGEVAETVSCRDACGTSILLRIISSISCASSGVKDVMSEAASVDLAFTFPLSFFAASSFPLFGRENNVGCTAFFPLDLPLFFRSGFSPRSGRWLLHFRSLSFFFFRLRLHRLYDNRLPSLLPFFLDAIIAFQVQPCRQVRRQHLVQIRCDALHTTAVRITIAGLP